MKEKIKENTNILIDTNVYLRLLPIIQWEELLKVIEKRKVNLLLPKQVRDEYWREREGIVRRPFNLVTLNVNEKYKKYNAKINKIIKAVEDYNAEQTKRQQEERNEKLEFIEKNVFGKLKTIDDEKDIIQLAFERYLRGNPPATRGNSPATNETKNKNKMEAETDKIEMCGDVIGDAIIWETLIHNYNDNDLVIITKDGHFIRENAKCFLKREWEGVSKCNLKIFDTLEAFLEQFVSKEVSKKIRTEETKTPSLTISDTPTISVGGPLWNAITTPGITATTSWTTTSSMPNLMDFNQGTATVCPWPNRIDKIKCAYCSCENDLNAQYCSGCGKPIQRFL